ncbi:MAG: hypothetical protein WC802_00290 [Patescibacteria group bacterium]|jgi:hypothetical protein
MSAERINQALTYWEDVCALERYLVMLADLQADRKFNPKGPLKYLGLRDALTCGAGWSNEYIYEGNRPSLLAMRMLPVMLYGWVESSKRIFRVSTETLDELLRGEHRPPPATWEKFPWPFESFAVSFETPLKWAPSNETYDTVLVVNVTREGRSSTLIQWLPARLAEYIPLPEKEIMGLCEDISEDIRNARARIRGMLPRKVRRDMKKYKISLPSVEQLYAQHNAGAERLAEEARKAIEMMSLPYYLMDKAYYAEMHDCQDQIESSSFIYAFCNLIARGVRSVGGHYGSPKTGEQQAESIADGAQLFEVGSRAQFATGERTRNDPTEPSGKTVRPHSRRGHYRRIRGSGPDAPKSQWVNSTWIHEEEAKVKGLIPVSETAVDTDRNEP